MDRRRDDDDDRRRSRDDDDRPRRRSGDDDDRGSRRGSDRDDDRGGRSRDRDDSDRGRSRGRDDDDRGGSSGFRYERRSDDQHNKRKSMGSGDFDRYLTDNVKPFKVNDGDNRVRVAPPTWKGAEHYGVDIYVHYGVGPDRQTYLCPNKMKGEACPVCEERAEARRDGDEKYAKQLEPKRRVLAYIVDRDHEREGLQAWAMPWTVDRDIIKVSQDKSTREVLPIDDPENGYDIEFEKTGSKDRTEYNGVAIARRSSALGSNKWLDQAVAFPLPDQLVYYDYDHIKKAFTGGGAARGRRDEDDRGDDRRDRGSSRGSDRDDDRGSRDRGDDRGDRRRDDRDEDRGASRSSGRDRSEDPKTPTYAELKDMTTRELKDLAEESRCRVDRDASPEEIMEAIAEKLGIEPPRRSSSRDDDDKPARRREDDDDKPRRRSGDDEDAPKRRNGDDEDDPKPRRRSGDDEEGSNDKLAEMRRRRQD